MEEGAQALLPVSWPSSLWMQDRASFLKALAAKKVAAVEDPQSNGLSVLCVSCPSTRSFVAARGV